MNQFQASCHSSYPKTWGLGGKGIGPQTCRLQSSAGCSSSWRCVVTSGRSSKTKNYKGVRDSRAAGTSILRVSFSRGKLSAKLRGGKHAGSGLARAGMGCLFTRTPSSRRWTQHLPTASEAGQQSCNSQRQSRVVLNKNEAINHRKTQ
jgi:hypothetical protein